MDLRRADLHTHTSCSDGLLSPGDLVKKGHAQGLRAMAVTDHDTIAALDEARDVGAGLGVEIIPGVELSVTLNGEELHLLGYYFDGDHAGLRAHLDGYRKSRVERGYRMVEALNRLGARLKMEDVLAHAGDGVIGRPPVAKALLSAGLVPSYTDAFATYLRGNGPAIVATALFPVADAIRLLHDAGGIAVLAHPGIRVDGHTVRRLIQLGLDGIETIHPSHSPALSRRYRDVVERYGLIETGGSDYH